MAKAEPVSKNSNNAWCQPSDGYERGARNSVDIDLDDFEQIATINNELPPNDEKFPKGAVILDTYKFCNKIVRKKMSFFPDA